MDSPTGLSVRSPHSTASPVKQLIHKLESRHSATTIEPTSYEANGEEAEEAYEKVPAPPPRRRSSSIVHETITRLQTQTLAKKTEGAAEAEAPKPGHVIRQRLWRPFHEVQAETDALLNNLRWCAVWHDASEEEPQEGRAVPKMELVEEQCASDPDFRPWTEPRARLSSAFPPPLPTPNCNSEAGHTDDDEEETQRPSPQADYDHGDEEEKEQQQHEQHEQQQQHALKLAHFKWDGEWAEWSDCVTPWAQQQLRFRVGDAVECDLVGGDAWEGGVVAGLFFAPSSRIALTGSPIDRLADNGSNTFRTTASYHVKLYSGRAVAIRSDQVTRIRRQSRNDPAPHCSEHAQPKWVEPVGSAGRAVPVAVSPVLNELTFPTHTDVNRLQAEVDAMLSYLQYEKRVFGG